MATISLKAYETSVTVLSGAASGELVSLAHGSLSAVTDGTHGIILDNTAANTDDLYADFEFVSGTLGAAPLATAWLRLYMWTTLDGTNYEGSPAAGAFNPDLVDDFHKVGDFYIPSGAGTSFRSHIWRKPLSPTKMKFQLYNLSGQALPATGASVIAYRYNLSSI